MHSRPPFICMKSKRFLEQLFFTLLVSTAITVQAQTTDSLPAVGNLRSAAQKMVGFFIKKNYDEYVKFVHPNVLSHFGGKEKMLDVLRKSLSQSEAQGFIIKNVTIGQPVSIIQNNGELESIVSQMIEIKTKDGHLISTAFLLALSTDKGNTWFFADTAGKTLAQMKLIFPQLSDLLVIPAKKQPVFYKD